LPCLAVPCWLLLCCCCCCCRLIVRNRFGMRLRLSVRRDVQGTTRQLEEKNVVFGKVPTRLPHSCMCMCARVYRRALVTTWPRATLCSRASSRHSGTAETTPHFNLQRTTLHKATAEAKGVGRPSVMRRS
jgi:hypothetical protein